MQPDRAPHFGCSNVKPRVEGVYKGEVTCNGLEVLFAVFVGSPKQQATFSRNNYQGSGVVVGFPNGGSKISDMLGGHAAQHRLHVPPPYAIGQFPTQKCDM